MKREAEQEVDQLEETVKKTEEKPSEEVKKEEKGAFIKFPKVRIAIIAGYNGINFSGSQKNPGVRTVEQELEDALFKIGLIAEYNYGDLKKIGWSRATRTDKRVHALQNVFSCKAHIPKNQDYEELRETLNKSLPNDVKVFCIIEVSNRFNAKNFTSNREYSYFLPTFMLTSIHHLFLGSGKKTKEPLKLHESDAVEGTKVEEEKKQSNGGGIKIIKQAPKKGSDEEDDEDEGDGYQNQDLYLNRNIDYITQEQLEMLYTHRLMDDEKERLQKLFNEFLATKKYHNYTRDMKSHDTKCQRFMMKLDCKDYMYINRETMEVSKDTDLKAIEFVHFQLKGQSFLYNQIRKMIGVIIQVFRGELDDKFIPNTLKDNAVNVALAPGDGLLLEKVCYDKYNSLTNNKKGDIMLQKVAQQEEINLFREEILKHIAQRELEGKAFTKWLTQFDDFADEYYIERKQ